MKSKNYEMKDTYNSLGIKKRIVMQCTLESFVKLISRINNYVLILNTSATAVYHSISIIIGTIIQGTYVYCVLTDSYIRLMQPT